MGVRNMSKKLLVLFGAFVLVLAVTSIADRKLADGERLLLRSPVTGERGEWAIKVDSREVVWDNGMWYAWQITAQVESYEGGRDSEPADDFLFNADQLVNDVHWIGGYFSSHSQDGDFDWRITFYSDDGTGTKPGTLINTWDFPNAEVNETMIEPTGAGGYFSYSVTLPTTLTFVAGAKYWISIQGLGDMGSISGSMSCMAVHTDQILMHEAVFRSVYYGYPYWTNLSSIFDYAYDLCFQLTYKEECNWIPGDDHKMHYPQLPDELGWDVNATTPVVLADDFECMQSGFIKDLHWWGSWKQGEEGIIDYFIVSIHEDIPADQSPTGYSMPGETLREWYIYEYDPVPVDPLAEEGWYDPSIELVLPDDHQAYFQYNACLDNQEDWFWQDSGAIYWLSISAVVEDPTGYGYQWGWKSSVDHWNNDGVWAFSADQNWMELYEPQSDPITNSFYIDVDPAGNFLGGGGEAYGDGWYFYPENQWWNIWFYDHPFSYERIKKGFIEFDVSPFDYGQPMFFEIAVNWSTDLWSIDFPEDSMPPLPGVPEEIYIGRLSLMAGESFEGHYTLPFQIPDSFPFYNPEWVSVDVRGYNYSIPTGIIVHDCLPSLDLAFVVTGGPLDSGACCFNDGSCTETDEYDCATVQGGTWMGAGTACEGDLNPANGIDDACETGPFGACCFTDGSCNDLSASDCANQGGTWEGSGTACLGDGNGNSIDDACEEPTGACCFTDGSCQDVTGADCSAQGGNYRGDYSRCLGDADANGVDDACENGWQPGDPHKMHYPQLPDESGWDVNATYPVVLADDWRCSQTGWIKDFHFWGSWRDDIVGYITSFTLMIHADIPAEQSPTGYSMPADSIWIQEVFDFNIVPYDPPTNEGWYDPSTGLILPDNHQHYYQYNIILHDSLQWFWQEQDTIYWLSITANVEDPTGFNPQWGWKSSADHWNDDAVWRMPGDPVWQELYEPGMVSDPITNHFFVQFDDQGSFIYGAGENAYGDGWYYYPMYDWWNIWFYDHPFAPERYKTIYLEFDVMPFEAGPSFFEIAVNWSTDLWSIEQPPTDSAPPLPGVDEDLYIGREILLATDVPDGHYVLEYVIPDYNPEWVSVDVRGFNFEIPDGFITHDCVGQQSLDLSFVVTGDIPCDCEPGNANGDATANILDITYLISNLYKGGPPPTPYSICSGDPNCDCVVNILDITYLISFLYKSGPLPCTCEQWLDACGPPLRK